jgi:SPP1 gp7 family putative phage head morphogenesis protein
MQQRLDFATPDEEAIRVLEKLILADIAESRRRAVEILSRQLTIGFYLGADRGLKETRAEIRYPEVNTRALDKLVAREVSPALEETYKFIAKELTDEINEGIRRGLTYDEIRGNLARKLETTFGREIRFERMGQTREVVEVRPDGKLRLVKKKITRPYTAKIEDYVDMLARTNIKKAYALGHIEGYKASGLNKWRYLSARDERTRPRHLALHGRVFVVGSADEALALQVMGEPNCRCRPSAFFDDPELDMPHEDFEEQRKEWARKWLDKKANNVVGQEIAKASSWNIAGQVRAKLKDDDTMLLTSIAGKSKRSLIADKVSEFKANFVSPPVIEKIYKRHMIAEKGGFTFNDIMIRLKNKPYGYSKIKKNALILDEGKRLAIIINPRNKVITAHKVRPKSIRRLKRIYRDESP